jgi:ABC-type amino acid transport substrate-binding protein
MTVAKIKRHQANADAREQREGIRARLTWSLASTIENNKTIMLSLLRPLSFFCSLTLVAQLAFAIPELDIEVVVGKKKKLEIGYKKPEVFNPITDQLYQSGYREYAPSETPPELKNVDGLERAKALRRIVACADAWYEPFSMTVARGEPPGIDIEILQEIARREDWRVEMTWTNTGTRFGHGAAFAKSIDKGYCDLFIGLVITGDDHHLDNHKLIFTKPYMGIAFVLVTQGAADGARTLEEVIGRNLKIGVQAYSPMYDYVLANNVPFVSYYGTPRLIDGLIKREVDAGMLWSGALAIVHDKHPNAQFQMVEGFKPDKGQRWNGAWAIPKNDRELKRFLDDSFDELLREGYIQRLFTKYHVPFYPAFED